MHPDTLDAITTAAGPDLIGLPPRGYRPNSVAEPPTVDHTTDEVAAQNLRAARPTGRDAAEEVRLARIGLRVGLLSPAHLDVVLARAGRALAGGAAVLALAVVAVFAGIGGTPAAQAAEAPTPDPASVSVTLTAGTVTVRVPVTTRTPDSRGRYCADVWGPTFYGRGFVGHGCARSSAFAVAVRLDSRFVPVGRSTLAVTDAVDPLATMPQTVNLTARRPSRFGVGTWTTTAYGDGLTVYATLYAYTPAVGRYTPQKFSPVKVQELQAGRWVTVAKGKTNSAGRFLITAIVGGGEHTLRVRRDAGATVAGQNGTAHVFDLYPTDVPDGVI